MIALDGNDSIMVSILYILASFLVPILVEEVNRVVV